jgi:hypothetical protein
MNERDYGILSFILALVALVLSVLPCAYPFLIYPEILPMKFILMLDGTVGFQLRLWGLPGLAIAVVSLVLIRRSQNRRMHKTVWAIAYFAILFSIFWAIASIIIFVQNLRE